MTQPSDLKEAIRLYKAGQNEASRQILRDQLLRDSELVNRLLWLAKASPDEPEALAAAELALALEPANEVAQRGVIAVTQRFHTDGSVAPVIDVMRITGMTQAQARSVIWPFRGHNRPIGVLLEEGVIGLNDLGFAIQKAYNAQVKKAASTLFLAHLLGDGLKDPLPPLTVVDGGSYAARNERLSNIGSGIIITIVSALTLVLFAALLTQVVLWIIGSPWLPVLNLVNCLALIAIAPFTYVFTQMLDRVSDSAQNYRAGVQAENSFTDAIRASLTKPWALFRDVEWPERKWGDTDAVLVGPGGIWAFEVKAYQREIRNIGDKWEYKTRWGWRKLGKSPGRQARRNAMNVKSYLDLHGVRVNWVNAVVIWAGEDGKFSVEDPAVPVWTLANLSDHLEELWQKEKLSQEQIEKSTSILTAVVEKDGSR